MGDYGVPFHVLDPAAATLTERPEFRLSDQARQCNPEFSPGGRTLAEGS